MSGAPLLGLVWETAVSWVQLLASRACSGWGRWSHTLHGDCGEPAGREISLNESIREDILEEA